MQTASLTNFANANKGSARPCSTTGTNVQLKNSKRTDVQFTAAIIETATKEIGGNVRKSLTGLANVCLRTVDNWKQGKRVVGMEEFFHLLKGEHGVAFLDAFWDCVPATTRERWIQTEILKRKLEAREAARKAEDEEIAQLQMSLNSNKR